MAFTRDLASVCLRMNYNSPTIAVVFAEDTSKFVDFAGSSRSHSDISFCTTFVFPLQLQKLANVSAIGHL